MRLTIHLFKDTVTSFDGLLRDEYMKGANQLIPLKIKQKLPFECQAFIQTRSPHRPKWYEFVGGGFELEGTRLLNSSSSFLLLLKVEARIFAISFGHGNAAIDEAKLEPRFGLRVVANSVSSDELRIIDSRNFDLVTRQRRTYLSVGSPLHEFGVDLNIDLLQRLTGKASSEAFARTVSGSKSLSIDVECDIKDLGNKCKEILGFFNNETSNELLEFVDNLNRIKAKDPILIELDNDLNDRLMKRNIERITIGYPEIPSEQVTKYRVSYRRQFKDFENLTMGGLCSFMDEVGDSLQNPLHLRIQALDDDDNNIGNSAFLSDYLVAEVGRGDGLFILTAGHWFKAELSYAKRIQDLVNKIDDLTGVLGLPAMISGEYEKDYNIRVASNKDFALLDRALVRYERHGKIEVCDLLSKDKHFIAVKYMKDSATLSHLFSQNNVSSELLRADPKYFESVKKIYTKKWPSLSFTESEPMTFVYALPTKKSGKIADNMFFFSKVNLISHIVNIRSRGHRVALCKIEIVNRAP